MYWLLSGFVSCAENAVTLSTADREIFQETAKAARTNGGPHMFPTAVPPPYRPPPHRALHLYFRPWMKVIKFFGAVGVGLEEEVDSRVDDSPVWLSTSGLGVYW